MIRLCVGAQAVFGGPIHQPATKMYMDFDLGEEVESWLKTHCQNTWFMDYHARHLKPVFLRWWVSVYGFPGNYADADAQDEYFTRMAFAQMGWMAAEGYREELIEKEGLLRP